jgi:DNA-binding NtrC family response regulator
VENPLSQKILREDLYYRLNVFRIHAPPLRERKEDIPELAKAIIGDLNRKHECNVRSLHRHSLERLAAYSWPGNVRELRNVLEWAVITAQGDAILPAHLPKTVGSRDSTPEPAAANGSDIRFRTGRGLDDIEREYISATLKSVNNNRKYAAQLLGVSMRTLYNRLSEINARSPGQGHAAAAQ